jgi:2-hydroxychromene-2-carboxylate isomerase
MLLPGCILVVESDVVELDCYYSLSSPWAYLGGPRLQDIVRRHRAKLALKPYDFPGASIWRSRRRSS